MVSDPVLATILRGIRATPHCVLVDFETSGLGVTAGTDVPLELAYCVLDDRGNIIREMEVLLNWNGHPAAPENLQERIEKTAAAMGGGRRFSATWERIQAEGVPAADGIERFLYALQGELRERRRLAGHNLIGFDLPVLVGMAETLQDFVFPNDMEDYHDVGLVEKGLQMGIVPYPSESPDAYYIRIRHGGKYKWNLHDYCRKRYNIQDDEWFANHAALSDCRLTARVLKAQLVAGGIL